MQFRNVVIGLSVLIFVSFISFGLGIKYERDRARALKHSQLKTLLPSEAWDLPQEAMEEIMAATGDETVDYTFQNRLGQESPDAQKIKKKAAKRKEESKKSQPVAVDKKEKIKDEESKQLKASESGDYIIQLGAFRDKEQAKALVKNLEKKGYGAYMTQSEVPGKGTWYRVRIGGFSDPAKAEVVLTRLEREEHIKAFMMGR